MRKRGVKSLEKELSGSDIQRILRLSGYSITSFARHLALSRSHVHSYVLVQRVMPLKYVAALRDFLGDEMFEVALGRLETTKVRMVGVAQNFHLPPKEVSR